MVKNDAKAANAYTVTLTPPRMSESVLPVPRYCSKITGQKSAGRERRNRQFLPFGVPEENSRVSSEYAEAL
jgi:hypothetical protein